MTTTSAARRAASSVVRADGAWARARRTLALPLLAGLTLVACSSGGTTPAPRWTVSTTVTAGGAISPAEASVLDGSTARFVLTPDEGHEVEGATGCGGVLEGDGFETGAVTGDCTIHVTFARMIHEVAAVAGEGGSVTPAVSLVSHGETASFEVTPAANHLIGSVSGCGAGTLVDDVYTTAPVTAPCTVSATFAPSYAVGGTVSGLAGTVLLGNGADQLLISADGAFSFPGRLPAGAAYAVTVLAQPAGLECAVASGSGVVGSADVSDVVVTCAGGVVALYPGSGANWNDYVENDGPDALHASGVACTGAEVGHHSACVHGGERRVFRVPSLTSCAGLEASDGLGAFDWRCDLSEGTVRFVSRLKDGARVADLIDFTSPRWKDNAVTVRSGGTEVAASAPGAWWSNGLAVDDDGMTASEMNAAGTLYLVSRDATGSYTFGADKVGLVIRRGATLSGNANSVVSASGRKFLWLEGDINGAGMSYGVNLTNTSFSVVRDVSVANASSRGFYLVSARSNRLQRVLASGAQIGLNVYSSSGNTFLQVTLVNGGHGLVNEASHDNVYLGLTLANNSAYGLYPNSSRSNVYAGVALANNGTHGAYVNVLSNSVLADLMTAHAANGLYLLNGSRNTFTGLLGVNGSSSNCYVSGGTDPGLVHGTCANGGSSDATLSTGVSLAAAFVGKIDVDEPVNADDTMGWANHPGTGAFDWLGFSHPLRSWGRDGNPFPSAGNYGRWVSGVGRVWDWSLRSDDGVLRDRLALPASHDLLTVTWDGGGSATFLRHAVELDGDGDGLCESKEICLYTPNIGAYQGHDELVDAGTVTGDVITDVTLLEHATNGR